MAEIYAFISASTAANFPVFVRSQEFFHLVNGSAVTSGESVSKINCKF